MSVKSKTFYTAMVFHCIDKSSNFERAYQNLKLAVRIP